LEGHLPDNEVFFSFPLDLILKKKRRKWNYIRKWVFVDQHSLQRIKTMFFTSSFFVSFHTSSQPSY
jgi:hypothetical protein